MRYDLVINNAFEPGAAASLLAYIALVLLVGADTEIQPTVVDPVGVAMVHDLPGKIIAGEPCF